MTKASKTKVARDMAGSDLRTSRKDGEATRGRILEAAGELFAATGLAETTSKAIAVRANTDLASINYHFGSRGGLYRAVLAEADHHFISIETLGQLATDDLSAEDKLAKLFEHLVDSATVRRGWHAKVLGRELLAPSSHLQTLRQTEIQPKLRHILTILSEITSIPRESPALLRCLISVAAPCVMLLAGSDESSPLAKDLDRMPREDLIAHLHTFALSGLLAIGRKYAEKEGI